MFDHAGGDLDQAYGRPTLGITVSEVKLNAPCIALQPDVILASTTPGDSCPPSGDEDGPDRIFDGL
jgi:hypothetical protein